MSAAFRSLRGFRRAAGPLRSFVTSLLPAALQTDAFFGRKGRQERRRWRELLLSSGEASRLTRLKDIHAGRRAFIIGNGPSINGQDLTRLSSEITFVTNWFANHGAYDAIRPTYYCISSHEVFGGWDTVSPSLNTSLRQAILAHEWRSHHFFPLGVRDVVRSDPGFSGRQVDYLIFERPKANILDKGSLTWDLLKNLDDGFTGIITFCLPLAYHMGIREVYLLGCDCDYQIAAPGDDKAYFYEFRKHATRTTGFDALSRTWGRDGDIFRVYEIVRRSSERRGMIIKNATEGGLLNVFERVSLQSLV